MATTDDDANEAVDEAEAHARAQATAEEAVAALMDLTDLRPSS